MGKTTSQKLRLGLFVINGLMLFVLAAHYIGDKQKMFGKTKHLKPVFNNVIGVQLGKNVRYSRINIGNVNGIEMINDFTIKVAILIDKTIFPHLKKNAIATVGFNGSASTMIKYYFGQGDVNRCQSWG